MIRVLTIDLPFPPSVNRIWRKGKNGNIYLHEHVRSWKRVCDNFCLAAGWNKKPIDGAFTATITLSREKRSRVMDADNRIKVVLDWLQRAGIIENDALAEEVRVLWGEAPEGCRVSLRRGFQPARH